MGLKKQIQRWKRRMGSNLLGRLDRIMTVAATRPCTLCGQPPFTVCIYTHTDANKIGTPVEKKRFIIYSLCENCSSTPEISAIKFEDLCELNLNESKLQTIYVPQNIVTQ